MPDADTTRALSDVRGSFRNWRRDRPFWAGVFTLLAGLIILFPPYASLRFGDIVVSLHTMAGVSALVIGIVLMACAVSFWGRPEFRIVAGIVTLVLSLVAIITANLGSFLIGTTLGLIGAALGIAWTPRAKQSRKRRKSRANAADSPESQTQDASAGPRMAQVGGRGGHA